MSCTSFCLKLNPIEFEELDNLAKKEGCSRSRWLRRRIGGAHRSPLDVEVEIKRDIRFQMAITPDELAKLKSLAAREGMTANGWLRCEILAAKTAAKNQEG